jgi:hypothetical protein
MKASNPRSVIIARVKNMELMMPTSPYTLGVSMRVRMSELAVRSRIFPSVVSAKTPVDPPNTRAASDTRLRQERRVPREDRNARIALRPRPTNVPNGLDMER